jgi:hypothetical protein
MAESANVSAWILLFVGFYALAAGVGELRAPNSWGAMLGDLERSPALRFLTGLATLAIGAAIYLTNPWRAGDWLSIVVTAIGGVAVLEGLLMLALGDRFIRFGRTLLGRAGRAWASFSALLGIAAIIVALAVLRPV